MYSVSGRKPSKDADLRLTSPGVGEGPESDSTVIASKFLAYKGAALENRHPNGSSPHNRMPPAIINMPSGG